MSIIATIRTMKQVHPFDILLVEIGNFYHAYGKDSYIISYLFDYKLKQVENVNSTGFPKAAINKVSAKLEDSKINYMILDRKNNYEVLEKEDFKDKNKYSELYTKAHSYKSKKNKIDLFYEYLISNIDDDIVMEQFRKLEMMIYERR